MPKVQSVGVGTEGGWGGRGGGEHGGEGRGSRERRGERVPLLQELKESCV